MLSAARTSLCFCVLLGLFAAPGNALTLHPGDLVVVDTNGKQLVRIDPNSLERDQIASWKTDVGRTMMNFPWGIAIDADHRILIADMNAHAVYAIDAQTGTKEILSGPGHGEGPAFDSVRGIALDGAGRAYVSNTRRRGKHVLHSVFEVDLATGDRRIISAADVGKGAEPSFPTDLAFDPRGALLVNMRIVNAVYRVSPESGDRAVISSPDLGTGPLLANPYGIGLLADGDVLVTDRKLGHVLRVETRTGNRSIVSSAAVGSGPPFKSPFGVAQAADGDLFVADVGNWNVYQVELATGNRRVIASAEVGTGPVIIRPRNLAIVPGAVVTPPPSFVWGAAGLAALGAIALFAMFTRQRRPSTGAAGDGGAAT